MKLSEIPGDRVVLILGAPRSGTTWLAKIFDSHPDVLYRHEPDTIRRAADLPWICDAADIPRHVDAARTYLAELIGTATVKTVGSLPMFPKRFETPPVRLARRAIIYGLRAAALTRPGRRLTADLRVPDLIEPARHPGLRVAIKSVGSLGRAGLFAAALPQARIVVIIRDVWGQVASMRRGKAGGKFEADLPTAHVADPARAARYGLTQATFATLPEIEQLAWNWAIVNEKVVDDIGGMERARLVRYQDLCNAPQAQARSLFDFARLAWSPQTEAFLRRSTQQVGRERYYGVFHDPQGALNRWRQELSPQEQYRIGAVVRATSLASFCPEVDA